MDAIEILVTTLVAGAFVLFVWFEVDSRRNDAQKKRAFEVTRHDALTQGTKEQSETQGKKVA